MTRSRISKLLAILGVGGVAMACNAGGEETITNPYPDTESEPNDTAVQATAVDGFQGTTKGYCESAGALDHYKMSAGTSGTAGATIVSELALQIALLASNGALLAQSVDASSPFGVTTTVDSAGGVVILRVTCPDVGPYDGTLTTP